MDKTELAIGRGEVYFEQFAAGTMSGNGERYIGNTPSLAFSRTFIFEEPRKSSGGVSSKAGKIMVGEDLVITFVTDNMDVENAAMWVGGQIETVAQTMGDGYSETFVVAAGRFYQLGKQIVPGRGFNNVWALNITDANGVSRNDELIVDETTARFGLPRSTSLHGETLTARYEARQSTSKIVKGRQAALRGALRFISRNPIGARHHYLFPSVVLYPRDTREVKGSSHQTMTFEAEALLPMIDYTVTGLGQSPGMLALVAAGVSLSSFPALESIFHSALNGVL